MKLTIWIATFLAAVAAAAPAGEKTGNMEHETTADGYFKATTNGWAYQQKRDVDEGATADDGWKRTNRGTWGG